MGTINARIVADSIDERGNRITTYVLTYPRMIHAEVMTHRMFSRNAASSRAIPFEKMLKMVQENPFIPIAWQEDHKGMQGVEYLNGIEEESAIDNWLLAKDNAIKNAKFLSGNNVTKQLCNRLLEPFMWYTALVTATEYDNFFELRCPKYEIDEKIFHSKKDYLYYKDSVDTSNKFTRPSKLEWLLKSKSGAEIHIQALAEAMWDAKNDSEPRLLKAGEWHIPFGDKMELNINHPFVTETANEILQKLDSSFSGSMPTLDYRNIIQSLKVKIAVARCARLSYMTFDGEIDYQKDIDLHDTLLKSKHASPFEHVARSMTDVEYSIFAKYTPHYYSGKLNPSVTNTDEGWCNNFRGFIQYRYLIENTEKWPE